MDQFESDLIKNTHEDHKSLRQPIVLDKCMLTNSSKPSTPAKIQSKLDPKSASTYPIKFQPLENFLKD